MKVRFVFRVVDLLGKFTEKYTISGYANVDSDNLLYICLTEDSDFYPPYPEEPCYFVGKIETLPNNPSELLGYIRSWVKHYLTWKFSFREPFVLYCELYDENGKLIRRTKYNGKYKFAGWDKPPDKKWEWVEWIEYDEKF